jgi:hypothetical protein
MAEFESCTYDFESGSPILEDIIADSCSLKFEVLFTFETNKT